MRRGIRGGLRTELPFIFQLFLDPLFDPHLLLHPDRHGFEIGGQSPWIMAKSGFQYAFQFDEGFFVKDQVVEVTHFAVAD